MADLKRTNPDTAGGWLNRKQLDELEPIRQTPEKHPAEGEARKAKGLRNADALLESSKPNPNPVVAEILASEAEEANNAK